MKPQNQIRSLFLACVALAGLLTTSTSSRADSNGTKPYKGSEVTVSRTDGLPSGTWTDAFLVQVRQTASAFYIEESDITSEGTDNYNGPFTEVDHQMLYVTSFSPAGQPIAADVYIWAEKTYRSGRKVWAAITGKVDFSTGNVAGEWTSYLANDPNSLETGAGTWSGSVRPDLGIRFYETTIVGRALTVGASKHQ
jgi:hypothetical protein